MAAVTTTTISITMHVLPRFAPFLPPIWKPASWKKDLMPCPPLLQFVRTKRFYQPVFLHVCRHKQQKLCHFLLPFLRSNFSPHSSFKTSLKNNNNETWFYHLPFKDFLLKWICDNETIENFQLLQSSFWDHEKHAVWGNYCESSLKECILKHSFYHLTFKDLFYPKKTYLKRKWRGISGLKDSPWMFKHTFLANYPFYLKTLVFSESWIIP